MLITVSTDINLDPISRAKLVEKKMEIQQVYFDTKNRQPKKTWELWDTANQALIDLDEPDPEAWIGKRPVGFAYQVLD